ncbi:MAG: 2Fe-2S iron-sulfur cluster binding domain-containing protein [Myxococcales bacterium]|nr:2Fe-2S iron-sulfur cluster binding domain-containing protein [Myxococcales bacterium]MBK7198576.1 2Fe-2S iron-sulfur cluster binding domain-containing protein [Myxococcales bacterium]
MTRVTFTNPGGAGTATVTVEASRGATLLEVAEECGARVGHACGGNLACSTCHVYVERGVDSLGEISDKENDIMDKAWAVRPESRLACQAQVAAEDVVVTISPESLKAWLDEHPELRGASKAS